MFIVLLLVLYLSLLCFWFLYLPSFGASTFCSIVFLCWLISFNFLLFFFYFSGCSERRGWQTLASRKNPASQLLLCGSELGMGFTFLNRWKKKIKRTIFCYQ